MQDDTIKSSVIYADLRGDLQTVERRGEIMREGKLRLLEPEPVVVTEHLTKRFQSVTALDDISLSIPEGRIIGMVGPNGSGKSTFLKILAGLYAEYGGEVRICGHKPSAATKAVTAYLPDKPGIPYDFTPEEAIKIYEGFFRDFDTEQCREMLKLFDIKETDEENHRKYTGVPLGPILDNLRLINESGIPFLIRLPIVPGFNDRKEHFARVRELARTWKMCRGIEIMPYHRLGAYKYAKLGREYLCASVEEPSAQQIQKWKDWL